MKTVYQPQTSFKLLLTDHDEDRIPTTNPFQTSFQIHSSTVADQILNIISMIENIPSEVMK